MSTTTGTQSWGSRSMATNRVVTAAPQRRGVGMAGAAVQGGCGRALHDFAQVHDRHLIRDVLHDREIVSDEQVGEPAALLQVGEQVQHLRLDRHVERAHRLVEHEEVWLDREGAGDPYTLPLA